MGCRTKRLDTCKRELNILMHANLNCVQTVPLGAELSKV
jgi:hypothetical protein